MADPRLGISYEEVHADYAPAIADGTTILYDSTKVGGSSQVGFAVTLSGNGTIALAADADPIYGVLTLVDFDLKCTVQVEGYMQLPGGTGALLTPGLKVVGALLVAAKGYVRGIAIATLADVAKGRGEIVDSSVTTAVWVRL